MHLPDDTPDSFAFFVGISSADLAAFPMTLLSLRHPKPKCRATFDTLEIEL